jgi:cruciform cutting endonuclease 1
MSGGLLKLKLSQLKALSTSLGLPSSGTKSVLLETILRASTTANTQIANNNSRPGPFVVKSVDMGVRNLSLVNLHSSLPEASANTESKLKNVGKIGISQWKRLDVEKGFRPDAWTPDISSFDVERLATIAHALVQREFLLPGTDGFSGEQARQRALSSPTSWPDVILIERQRFRSGSSASILEWTIRVNMLENMLHAILHTLAPPGTVVVASVNPKAVLAYWMLRTGAARTAKGYKETKAFKTQLAAAILDSQGPKTQTTQGLKASSESKMLLFDNLSGLKLETAPHGFDLLDYDSRGVAQVLGAAKVKDDDLADSFLQGLAWLEWMHGRQRLAAVVRAQGSSDNMTTTALADFVIEEFGLE